MIALFAVAAVMAGLFVLRLATAPEPLIPISILGNAIVRYSIAANAFGWGAIIGMNIILPTYLQGVMGFSATQAGLSLVIFMVALNTSAGFAGQVLGRVHHYKLLPMAGLLLAIGGVVALALWADRMTPLLFELLLLLIGIGFGPLPSLTAVTSQNVVARHQLGIAVGTQNFVRNLYATFLIAVFGAIILAGAPQVTSVTAGSFAHVFWVAAASLTVALIAMLLMEERPLRSEDEMDAG